MNKYAKLLNNSLIFALGNLGSKVIVILLVPLYTFYLTTQDYGLVDLVASSQALLMPFITITAEQALLRYIIGEKDKDIINSVFSTALFISIVMLVFFLFFCVLFYYFHVWSGKIIVYFYLLVFMAALQILFSTYLRAIGKSKNFALSGVIQVLSILFFNLIFLVYMKLGVDGYLISLICSYFVSNLYCFAYSRCLSIRFSEITRVSAKKIIAFSLPLIPNYSMWWVVNNSTRYVVLSYLGLSANGLFAVASKIPTCINVFVTVFQQAWQISAFEEFDSHDRSKYYSTVFRAYYQFLFIIASFLLVLNKIIFENFVSHEFMMAWKMVPLLILGVLYQTFSSFLGTIYTANYMTKDVFLTSFVGAGISIGANFIFIPMYGEVYAGLGASLGFFIMWLLRLIGTRKIVYTKIYYLEFILLNGMFLVQTFLLFLLNDISGEGQFFVQFLCFLMTMFLSKNFLSVLFLFFKNKILSKYINV
ncbi:oligosaccharide flippase family protein [Klebsiella sp. CN_Kp090]|uniref:lipopolysaccharide biosynthesis protein n=1 Tax=Klebsiella TaxID=570 RepID=UPI001C3F080D|nr:MULTISPECIES: oligosaccharide flippase family protein [Klebsiella]MBV5417289.1 oligosaccharide flippase family protein [Klebsiella pneumoniae]MDX6091284.1 oligosaccharide flippase family protein [Klebsiella sp. CN_Kp090]